MKYLVNRTITLGVGVSKYPLICFLCLTAAVPVVHAANLRLNIEGLEGQLNQNVRVQLSNISQDEVVPNGRFRARVEKAIKDKDASFQDEAREYLHLFKENHNLN